MHTAARAPLVAFPLLTAIVGVRGQERTRDPGGRAQKLWSGTKSGQGDVACGDLDDAFAWLADLPVAVDDFQRAPDLWDDRRGQARVWNNVGNAHKSVGDLLRTPRYGHPYHWVGFILVADSN